MKQLFIVIFIFAVLFSVIYYGWTSRPQENQLVANLVNVQTINPVTANPVTAKVQQMSLDEKIGQMLIVGFEHNYVDSHIKMMIEKYHIGGINLLKRNVKDKNQITEMISQLQKLSDIPIFISTDQEGGAFSRFKFLKELTVQTKIMSVEKAEALAYKRAIELRALGVNMNYSPVLDYVSDPKSYLYSRTFGTSPEKIGDLGNAMIKGYMKGGVIPVSKHFPGYGNIYPDPHKNEAVTNISSDDFLTNLLPFIEVIQDNREGAIMTAHIKIPSIDAKPATESHRILTQILRDKLGFEGIIITDDMEMASVGTSTENSALEAVKAGADMIISTYTPEKHIKIFNRLKEAVNNGEIAEEKIDKSVERILKLKNILIL